MGGTDSITIIAIFLEFEFWIILLYQHASINFYYHVLGGMQLDNSQENWPGIGTPGKISPMANQSHCIRGGCNTPDEWCRVLWGPTGTVAGPGCVGYNLIRDPNSQSIDTVANCGLLRPRGDERWREIEQWPSKPCYDW
ncbi:unnamed protein product [Rodentolepis nana]|uniref:ACR domain-containing protein n=1 Tax=Rodentolepis nana TaxID=102285 RepID=A0A0R3TI60_RODNA|nr:unnamed protein product [Rodentolepis nana]